MIHLIGALNFILTMQLDITLSHSADAKLFASSLVEKVATDIVGKNPTELSGKERESISKRIGIAMKAIFPQNIEVHNTHLLGIKHHQKRHYVGLSFV